MVYTLNQVIAMEDVIIFDSNTISRFNLPKPITLVNSYTGLARLNNLPEVIERFNIFKGIIKEENVFTISAVYDEFKDYIIKLRRMRNRLDKKLNNKRKISPLESASSDLFYQIYESLQDLKGTIKTKILDINAPDVEEIYGIVREISEKDRVKKEGDYARGSITDELIVASAICSSMIEYKKAGIISNDSDIADLVEATYDKISKTYSPFALSVYSIKKDGRFFKKTNTAVIKLKCPRQDLSFS